MGSSRSTSCCCWDGRLSNPPRGGPTKGLIGVTSVFRLIRLWRLLLLLLLLWLEVIDQVLPGPFHRFQVFIELRWKQIIGCVFLEYLLDFFFLQSVLNILDVAQSRQRMDPSVPAYLLNRLGEGQGR